MPDGIDRVHKGQVLGTLRGRAAGHLRHHTDLRQEQTLSPEALRQLEQGVGLKPSGLILAQLLFLKIWAVGCMLEILED